MSIIEAHDRTKLYYSDWGTGPPVVLIHGWPLNADMWEKQAIYLAENGHRVITYDRRGFGQSGQAWNGYDYDTFAADLQAVMEKLDLRNATLVGFSMGGGEVVRYLSRYGTERVAKAVLISSVTPYLLQTPDNPSGLDANIFHEIEKSIRDDRFHFLKTFSAKFFGRTVVTHSVSEAVLEWTLSMGLTASPRSTLEAAKAWSTTDFREEMTGIDIPVLVIHGGADATVPIDASGRRSAELLPNSKLSVYEHQPHGLIITAAERLNTELLAFLREYTLGEHETVPDDPGILLL
jgi:pimeloyl-ACP methyl ester carboxylesterase